MQRCGCHMWAVLQLGEIWQCYWAFRCGALHVVQSATRCSSSSVEERSVGRVESGSGRSEEPMRDGWKTFSRLLRATTID